MTTTTKTYPILPNQNTYSYKVNNQLPYQENLFFPDKSTSPSIHQDLGSTPGTIDDFTKREILFSNILDKIAPKYEEIGNLLSHIPEPKRTKILGGILSRALCSDNPINFINKQLKDIRKAKFYNRMLDDASVFLGIDKQSTKEYLKMGLKEDVMD